MSEDVVAGPRVTRVEGRFEPHRRYQSEAHAEIVGPGSLAVTDEGLHVVAEWNPVLRRFFSALLGGSLAVGLDVALTAWTGRWWLGLLAGAAAIAATWVVVRRTAYRRPYERVVPWAEVSRPGVSEDALVFEVKRPQRGVVRFTVPGWGLVELRPLAQEIKRRARR